jgi:hypothetical protein
VTGSSGDALAVLQRIRERRTPPREQEDERCDLCTEPIGSEHGHVVDVQARNLLCACRGCTLLFTAEGAGGGHFRAVPETYRALPEPGLTPAEWDTLQIPVSVAFFFVNSTLSRVAAFYPGPAGATESELPLETWEELAVDHPALRDIRPDVEALLVRVRPDRSSADCYLVPIDACYELVGHLRRLWRGFDGGQEARDYIAGFFDRVASRAGGGS